MYQRKNIPDFHGYKADSNGNIWSYKRSAQGKLMKTWIHDHYPTIQLRRKKRSITISVHRLVCLAFHGYPKTNQEVRHLDGQSINILPSNLQWGTRRENAGDTIRLGSQRGTKNSRAKLNNAKVQSILHKLKSGIFLR